MQAVNKQRARTREDKALKRRRLLDSARELFSENGYSSTSIEMITEAAGVGTGTFYSYFSSKIEVFRVLYGEGIETLHEMIREAVSWPGMSASARLSALASAYHRFFKEHRDLFDILTILHLKQRDFQEVEVLIDRVVEQSAALFGTIQGVIEQGAERRELNPLDPWKATCSLWAMMNGMMLLEQQGNLEYVGLALEDVFKQGLEILLYGMVRPERWPPNEP